MKVCFAKRLPRQYPCFAGILHLMEQIPLVGDYKKALAGLQTRAFLAHFKLYIQSYNSLKYKGIIKECNTIYNVSRPCNKNSGAY